MTKQIDANILKLYEVKKQLGSGAYGHVWKVNDCKTNKEYALKKIFDAFHNDTDAQRTYRQITVLHELDHYNIIKLHRVLKARNNKDLYLVFDYMEADLQSLVGEQILEDIHIRFVIYQILRALKYLHSAQLIHRDLKPSNILINSQCEVKLCDFGLVRSLTHQENQQVVLTQQVATRWYRSPEVLLGSNYYGKQTDVWSVGCIIAQLLMGEPLFPGDSTINQLQRILQFTGVPSKHQIDSIKSETAQSLINQLSVNRKSNQDYFKKPNLNKQLINLIKRMLEFNPRKRITIQEALELQIFSQFRNQKLHEDICTKFIVPEIDDNQRLTVQMYRRMIYCDIQRRYPQNIIFQYQSVDRYSKQKQKQNKRVIRSHHSLNRKKSSQNFKTLNSSGNHLKKQQSCSLHYGDNNEKIRRLKKQPKKQRQMPSISHKNGQYLSYEQNQIGSPKKSQNYSSLGLHNQNSVQVNKIQSIYRGSPNNFSKEYQPMLAKVRSRKIVYKSKSKQRIQNNKSIHIIQKRRILR